MSLYFSLCWSSVLLLLRVPRIAPFQLQLPNNHDSTAPSTPSTFMTRKIEAKDVTSGIPTVEARHLVNSNVISSLQRYLCIYLLNVDDGKRSSVLPNKESDEVVRVVDANTVKLKRNGLVSFAAVQTPSGYNDPNFRFPDCMTKSPSSKLRQLLPAKSKVYIQFTENEGGSRPRGALVENQDSGEIINMELVREGFAKPVTRGRLKAEEIMPGISGELSKLHSEAQQKEKGIYKRCDEVEIANDNQFEPLERTTEIQWGDDGGKIIMKERETLSSTKPLNPGDSRGCSDFKTFEDALRWYETYYPYYGDVSRLDRDGDGIPCSGLPHTQDKAKYRIKKPLADQGNLQ